MNLYQPTITGSLSVSGSVNISGSITIAGGGGTISGTASYATNAELLDGLDSTVFTLTSSFAAQTASFTAFTSSILSYTASQNILNGTYTLTSSFAAQTASFTAFTASILAQTASLNSFSASVLSYTSSINAKTSSFATTGSNTFIGTQTISGSILQSGSFTSTGTLTAQTLVVQTITSSVDFVTGSTRFGSLLDNTHVFSGSVTMNPGGLFVSSSNKVGIGTTNPDNSYQGLTIFGTDPSLRLKTSNASGWTWIEFVNSSGTNNFSMGVNQTTPFFGIKAGAGMDSPNFAINSSGNVGIGTTTIYSGAKLHILGGILAVEPTNGNTNSEILIGRGLSSLGTSAGSGITAKINFAFEGSNDNFYQELGFVTTTANQTRINSAADFYISTKAAGASSPSEKFRITSTGVVALNATDATYISFAYLGTTKGFIGVAGASTDIISGAPTGDMTIRAQQSMRFSTGGDGERMRILNNFTLAGSSAGTGGPTQVIGTTSMCGILFVSIGTQNCAAIFIINAGSPPVLVSQTTSETRFSITNDNGNTANVYVSGTDIVLRNNIQATRAFYCQFFGKL